MGVRQFRRNEQPEFLVVGNHFFVELDHHLVTCTPDRFATRVIRIFLFVH